MNPFLFLYYTITNNARSAVDWAKTHGTHTKRFLVLATLVSLVILTIGICADSKGTIVVAGFLNALWLLFVWGRAAILIHVVALASRGADAIWEKLPEISRAEAADIVRNLRGISLLIMIPWVLALSLPVRENVVAFFAALTFLLLMAGIAYFRKWDGRVFWTVYALYALCGFVMSIMLLASPESAERIRGAVSYRLSVFRNFNARTDSLAKAELDARAADVKLDQELLKEKLALRQLLRLEDSKTCPGICPQHIEEYRKLVDDINKLKAATYWPAEPVQKVEEAQATSSDSAQNAEIASQAPPEVQKINTGDKVKAQPEADEVYSELSKYIKE